MAFIIIDLEFNNLSEIHKYYPNIYKDIPNLKELDLINEIIEIGAIKVDMYMKPLEELKVYIKPSVIPVVNPKILSITNIKHEELENGVSFNEGLDMLKNMVDKGDIICSWAKDDIAEIIRNANHHGYSDLSWIERYLDIQEYTTKILGKKNILSLKNALQQLKIKVDESKLHDALNDSRYTLSVFKNIYNARAVKQFIVSDIFDMPALEIKSLQNFKLDYSKINPICPKCKRNIELDYNFTNLGWRFVAIGTCPKCNSRILEEVIVKKSLSGEMIYREVYNIIDEIEFLKYENRIIKKNSNV